MKKHIIGFAIFSLIVATAAGVFQITHIAQEETEISYSSATINSCWKMKRDPFNSNEIKIRQAVLNLNTKELDLELSGRLLPQSHLALHIFAKDIEGSRYLKTVFSTNSLAEGNTKITHQIRWADDLDSTQNIYLVPEVFSNRYAEERNFEPKFQEEIAVPVSIFSGKSSK